MKLTAALIALAMSSASAMSISSKTAHKVLRASASGRALADLSFLDKYTLKMIACHEGEQVTDPQNGNIEYNAVVIRMCPTDSGCDDNKQVGCTSGYGDFVVGLDTYVAAYFQDQKDNMQWDDHFQVDRYAQCAQYQVEGGNNNDQYYIGPACTSDSAGVRLELFTDNICQTPSSTSFSDIAQGWTLPYSDGGLVATDCLNCIQNDGNGNYQERQLCMNIYDDAASKCETQMQYYSAYGQDNSGCDTIKTLLPQEKRASHKAGKVFGWIVFVCVVVGLAGYVVWWRKSKSDLAEPLGEKQRKRGFRLFGRSKG